MTLPLGGIRSPRERTIWLERKVAEQSRAIDQLFMLANANNQPPERPPWEVASSTGGGATAFSGTLSGALYRGATVNAVNGATTKAVDSTNFVGYLPAGKDVSGFIDSTSGELVPSTAGVQSIWVSNPSTWNGSGSKTATSVTMAGVTGLSLTYTDPKGLIALLGGSIDAGVQVRLDWDDHNLAWIFLTAATCPTSSGGSSGSALGELMAFGDVLEGSL